MLSDFVKMLGKYADDPYILEMEKFFKDRIDIAFNDDAAISKITIHVNGTKGKELLYSISSILRQDIDEENLISSLGEPTYRLNFPSPMKKQAIWFYRNTHCWLGLNFKDNIIENISVMSSEIIPDSIKLGRIPIRTCRS